MFEDRRNEVLVDVESSRYSRSEKVGWHSYGGSRILSEQNKKSTRIQTYFAWNWRFKRLLLVSFSMHSSTLIKKIIIYNYFKVYTTENEESSWRWRVAWKTAHRSSKDERAHDFRWHVDDWLHANVAQVTGKLLSNGCQLPTNAHSCKHGLRDRSNRALWKRLWINLFFSG